MSTFTCAYTSGALMVALLTASCSGSAPTAKRDVEQSKVEPSVVLSEPLAVAFGIDRVDSSCSNFLVYATDRDRRHVLRVRVDVETLGLGAGVHRLDVATAAAGSPRPTIEIEVSEYAKEIGEAFCTDVAIRIPAVTNQWHAVSGNLEVTISEPANDGERYDVDVALDGVDLRSSAGDSRKVDARFEKLLVGWFPG